MLLQKTAPISCCRMWKGRSFVFCRKKPTSTGVLLPEDGLQPQARAGVLLSRQPDSSLAIGQAAWFKLQKLELVFWIGSPKWYI